jgi:hypothetical protein
LDRKEIIHRLFEEYKDEIGSATPEQWLSNHQSIAYEREGSVALFTFEYPGVYSGHWFFKVRGRDALNLAREFLKKLFTETDAKAIRGLTPIKKPAARWAARQVGFTSYGNLTINNEEYELFCMTKKEFENGLS